MQKRGGRRNPNLPTVARAEAWETFDTIPLRESKTVITTQESENFQ